MFTPAGPHLLLEAPALDLPRLHTPRLPSSPALLTPHRHRQPRSRSTLGVGREHVEGGAGGAHGGGEVGGQMAEDGGEEAAGDAEVLGVVAEGLGPCRQVWDEGCIVW